MSVPVADFVTVLWWIGDLVWALAVIPLVVVLVVALARRARVIERYLDEMARRARLAASHLDALDDLSETARLVEEAGVGLHRWRGVLSDPAGRGPR